MQFQRLAPRAAPTIEPNASVDQIGKPRSSSGRSPLVPRASAISRSLTGPIRSIRPMPKRRTADAVLPGNAVDPGQAVGRQRHHQSVERAPALVAVEQLRVAKVEAEPRAFDQHLRQRGGVAEAEVEPLAGDRMDGVRGVADQRQPLRR